MANRLACVRGLVLTVTGVAGAYVRFRAISSCLPLALFVAYRTTIVPVRVQPVALVASANVRRDAIAVEATVCA